MRCRTIYAGIIAAAVKVYARSSGTPSCSSCLRHSIFDCPSHPESVGRLPALVWSSLLRTIKGRDDNDDL